MKHTKIPMKIYMKILLLIFIALLSFQFVTAIGIGTFETGFEYTPDQVSSIKYYIVKEKAESPTVSLDFIGNLSQYATFRMDNFWYSTRLDELDVSLTKSFDLTSVGSATLTFYTKYDIEYGWDFGYVEISTNNGSSWVQLSGTTTTTYRAPGAYVGINGAPSYTGSVSDWTLETIDLTPYVGNDVLLRFRYVSDSYYVENGWFVDDISIAEIGFFDDVGSSDTTWTSSGWLKNIIHLDEGSKTIPIYIDFTIPAEYVSDDTVQKLVVSEVPGTGQGYNPSYGSVETVIATFPPLIKIEPPAPPPPDDSRGNNGEIKPYHARIIGETITFFIDEFLPDKILDLFLDNQNNLVRLIRILVKEFIEDAVIRITHLSEKPDSIKQELPDVYAYFEISTLNLFNSDIDHATIQVAVDKSWINNKDAKPADIVVSRFSIGFWSDLETRLVDEENEFYVYDASSPGFSVFAVRIRSPIPDPKLIEPVPTEKPNITDIKPVMVIIGNESVEKVTADIIEELMQKSNITEDDDMSSIPLTLVSVQKPETVSNVWSGIVLAILVMSIIFISIILFIFRNKMQIHKQELKKSNKVEENILDEQIKVIKARLKK